MAYSQVGLDIFGNRNLQDATTPIVAKVYASDAPNKPSATDTSNLIGLCPASAAEVTVNALLAANAGGITELSEGTLNITGSIIVPSGTTLRGIGWGTKIYRTTSTYTATLAEDLDNSETEIDVSDGSVFTAGQAFTIDDEAFYIASISGDKLTVATRPYGGTTAATHTSGAAILAYGPMIVNALSQEGGAVNVNVSDLWLDAGEDDADVTQVLSVGVTLEQVSGGSIKHVFCQNTVTPAGHHMYRGWGVGAYKSSGLLIERNETTDCWGGIQIRNACSNITVSKNKSYLNHYEGIIVGGGTPVGDSGTATGEGCTDITIDKNTVYDNGQAGSSANIYVEDQATSGDGNPHLRIKITNNVVVRQSSGTAAGIALVRQSGATLTNVYSLVSGNTIKGITGSGIQGVRVLYCPSVEVIGNYVDGCQGANISFNNSPDGLCTENYALNSTGSYGIALTASHRTLVTSNVVSGNNSHGIDVNSSTDVTVNNNTVSAKANAAGIKFEGSSDARPIIKNNTIKCTGTGNSGHGIALAIGAGADYATIQNNTIIMTQDSGTSHTQAGIDTYADYGKISGNKIVATTPASGFKYGIRLQSGADSNWVENNELAGYTAGLLDSGASNIIQNNNGYTTHAGTANTGVTATESSDGHTFKTTLTVSQTDALTFADNAALADGYLLYTFPAGAIIVESAYMSMAVTAAEDTTATPDVGLGTTEGSGANATLQAVGAAAENILTGQSAANCSGTATVKTVADQVLVIEAGDDHTVYFNVAATWADTAGADLTANIAGTVVLVWRFMA